MIELKDTMTLMESVDYKERFQAEYSQTKIRLNKLHQILIKYKANKLDFKPTCPISLLEEQEEAMRKYLDCLEARALLEDIDLL